MNTKFALLLAALATACTGGGTGPETASPSGASAPSGSTTTTTTTTTTAPPVTITAAPAPVMEAAARADSLRESFNEADVAFITHMIHHHAQALVMARMAESHGASSPIRVLAGRIINAQNDEIAIMQRWLRERDLEAPDPAHMDHGPHGQHMDMPGMLTPEQMQRLAAARGPEFDRLFLQLMIQHHEGALVMVEELFDTYGAAQGDAIFKLASDIGVDQETEIDRMRLMLREMIVETGVVQEP